MASKKRPADNSAGKVRNDGQLSRGGIDQLVQKWAELVKNEVEQALPLPIKALQGEGIDLAELVDHYFRSVTRQGITYPALESVSARGEVTAETARELRELVACIGSIHGQQLILLEQMSNTVIDRADELLAEFRAALSYLLEDGTHETGERQLAKLRDEFQHVSSHDGLAAALEGYSELLAQYRTELEGVAGIDLALLDEAPNVSQSLRQRSAVRLTGRLAEEQRELLRLRNRLVSCLVTRMSAARRAFRFVFRGYPDIARKAGSEYSRNQRRAYRAQQTETVASAPEGQEVTGA